MFGVGVAIGEGVRMNKFDIAILWFVRVCTVTMGLLGVQLVVSVLRMC